MVLLVYVEGICVFYSSYIIFLVVFGCFAPGNSRFSLFSLILQVCGREAVTISVVITISESVN